MNAYTQQLVDMTDDLFDLSKEDFDEDFHEAMGQFVELVFVVAGHKWIENWARETVNCIEETKIDNGQEHDLEHEQAMTFALSRAKCIRDLGEKLADDQEARKQWHLTSR